jgi:hypothetical protein
VKNDFFSRLLIHELRRSLESVDVDFGGDQPQELFQNAGGGTPDGMFSALIGENDLSGLTLNGLSRGKTCRIKQEREGNFD